MTQKVKTSWDLSLIIKNASEKNLQKLRNQVKKESYKFINKWRARNDYLENPKILKQALDEYNEWNTKWGANASESFYFHLKLALDQNSPQIKANENKAMEFALQIQNEIQFFELKISKIDPNRQKTFLSDKNLVSYRHFLEKLFGISKYLLSEPEEKIMNLKSLPAHANWVKMTQSFLSKEQRIVPTEKGRKETKSFSDLLGLMESQQKSIRDSAAKEFNQILEKHVDVAENEINSILQDKKSNDELRGYKRPDHPRHLADDVDSKVVDALIKTVTNNFDVSKRYYKLKARLLGVKKLAYHERNVEYGKIEKKYSYSESISILQRVFANLDNDFGEIFQKFVNEGRIDVYPNQGKRSGAFCAAELITNPVYILLNWTDKLNDVRTFAHEMGHGINDELIKASQHAMNFGTPTSTAEVASTFMEDFVTEELLKEADEELKLALMVSKLNQDISSIFRQVACYNLETDLHSSFRQKGYLSKDEIGKLFQKNMMAYMGNSVDQSQGSENWWVYWNHIRYFFYVYSYASGLLISKSLQASVKKDPKFISKVKEFLSAGLSDSPKNIFLKLGIDISDKNFWGKGISEINNLLNETEELAKKLKRI